MSEVTLDDESRSAIFISYSRRDDDHLRRLQSQIADLGEIRDQVADETRQVVVFVDNCALTALNNLNRCLGVRDTRGRQHKLTQADGAAPTFTRTTPNSPTCYALFADVAAPWQALNSPLPDTADALECAEATAATRPAGGTAADLSQISERSGAFGFDFLARVQPSDHDAGPVAVRPPAQAIPHTTVAISLDLLPGLRDDLIRLVDGMRAALCLTLMLVLAALARRPDARSFVLVLIATARRYGRRGEPDDHLLPAHRSIAVVRGELALVA